MRFSALFAALLLSVAGVGSAAAQQARWVGAYVCSQGVQGMTLTITQLPEQQLSAVFDFYPNPENPGVGSGSFEMRGRTNEAGRLVDLTGARWIRQPDNTEMVDFRGEISADAQALTGAISAQNVPFAVCTVAALVRAP